MAERALTDEGIATLRERIGIAQPHPQPPHYRFPNEDAFRHVAEAYGDDNPLFVTRDHGAGTRWGAQIAPPGFEATMGYDCSPEVPEALARETRGALRGVQLFHSGNESRFYRPIEIGDVLHAWSASSSTRWVLVLQPVDPCATSSCCAC